MPVKMYWTTKCRILTQQFVLPLVCLINTIVIAHEEIFNPDLPDEQLPYFYNQFPDLNPKIAKTRNPVCWGYEDVCPHSQRYSACTCTGNFIGWASSVRDAVSIFYNQADFGYIRERRKEFQMICTPKTRQESSLKCSKDLTFCTGRNLMIDFSNLEERVRTETIRYKMDVLNTGEIKVQCDLNSSRLESNLDNMSPLQSWAPELRNLQPSSNPIAPESSNCDVFIDKPTYIMKLDATVNMYHHFCDFFNLYMSLHLNATEGEFAFSKDNHILIWENMRYNSVFGDVWDAFTENPLWNLATFAGKKVCFRNVVFPLLPRMMYGLFYNTPLINGCQGSGLFQAFSKFVLHRLRIAPAKVPERHKLRVTLISRDTAHRKILNENELVKALEVKGSYTVKVARFSWRMPLKDQLSVTAGTDILIGMHGAGLTHMLMLPDWAGVLEMYHCDDPQCYSDLARLRGLHYATWQDETKVYPESDGKDKFGAAHKKFVNYSFDVEEFVRMVGDLAALVVKDNRYISSIKDNHVKEEL